MRQTKLLLDVMQDTDLKITKDWAMPNKWTFTIKPIKKLLDKYINNNHLWVDPFCGENSPADDTNDLNPKVFAKYNLDALEFLQMRPESFYDGVLFDPPYSARQASECYKSFGKELLTSTVTNAKYWSQCKDEVARISKYNGIVISFGWNSMGIGKNRGFKQIEILLLSHGGIKNDTIVTVEKKIS